MFVCVHTCTAHLYESEDNIQRSVLFFSHVNTEFQHQARAYLTAVFLTPNHDISVLWKLTDKMKESEARRKNKKSMRERNNPKSGL